VKYARSLYLLPNDTKDLWRLNNADITAATLTYLSEAEAWINQQAGHLLGLRYDVSYAVAPWSSSELDRKPTWWWVDQLPRIQELGLWQDTSLINLFIYGAKRFPFDQGFAWHDWPLPPVAVLGDYQLSIWLEGAGVTRSMPKHWTDRDQTWQVTNLYIHEFCHAAGRYLEHHTHGCIMDPGAVNKPRGETYMCLGLRQALDKQADLWYNPA